MNLNSELLMCRKIGFNRNIRNRVNKTEFGRIVLNNNPGINMPALTPEELRACIAADAQTSPSTFLADDSFAAWCYDHLSLGEARAAFERDADPNECEQWGLTALEWRAQVEMAIIALTAAARMQ